MATMTDHELAESETISLIASDRVEGTDVYNTADEHLGSIDKLMIDKRSGKVSYAVMAFGGFLGLGESRHPLPWELLTYDPDREGYVVNLDKEKLEGAPMFERESEPDWRDRRYHEGIFGYYGVAPYF